MYINFNIEMMRGKVQKFLEDHRKNHEDEYQNQLAGWKNEMDVYAVNVKNWASSGGQANVHPKEPPKPQYYTEDYDKLIAMVKCHIAETLQLNQSDYETIVEDKFGWKDTFLHNSTMYSNK